MAQSPVIEPASNRLTGLAQTVTTTRAGSTLTQSSSQARYTLDPAGSLLSDGLTRYDYDAANRLSQARVLYQGQPHVVDYQHNALGQRVFTSEPRAEAAASTQSAPASEGFITWLTRILASLTRQNEPGIPAMLGVAHTYGDGPLPAWALLGDYDNGTATGGGSTEYVWLPTEDGSAIPIGMVRNGSVLAIHTDHLGTPRLMTDEQARPVWQWPYSGFGEIEPTGVLQPQAVVTTTTGRSNSGRAAAALKATAPQQRLDLRFPGQVRDAVIRLNHNFHRAYDQDRARYTQIDPSGMDGGLNRFGYVGGNPLSFTDPTGLLFESTLGGLRRNTTLDQAATFGAAGNAAAAMGLGGAVGGAAVAGAGAAYMTYVPAPARTAIGLLKGVGDDAVPPPTPPQPPLLTPPAIIRPGGFSPPSPPVGFCPRP